VVSGLYPGAVPLFTTTFGSSPVKRPGKLRTELGRDRSLMEILASVGFGVGGLPGHVPVPF